MACACQGCSGHPSERAVYATRIGIPADGTPSDLVRIGTGDRLTLGWELQVMIEPAADSRNTLDLTLEGAWQSAGTLSVVGVQFDRGGRLFVPYPGFSATVTDQAGSAAIGRWGYYAEPWSGGRPPLGTTILYGITSASIGAATADNITVPAGAGWFRVLPAEVGDNTLTVSARDGAGGTWGTYTMDLSAAAAPGDLVSGWRRCPPVTDGATPVIAITNHDPIETIDIAIEWRYHLGDLT